MWRVVFGSSEPSKPSTASHRPPRPLRDVCCRRELTAAQARYAAGKAECRDGDIVGRAGSRAPAPRGRLEHGLGRPPTRSRALADGDPGPAERSRRRRRPVHSPTLAARSSDGDSHGARRAARLAICRHGCMLWPPRRRSSVAGGTRESGGLRTGRRAPREQHRVESCDARAAVRGPGPPRDGAREAGWRRRRANRPRRERGCDASPARGRGGGETSVRVCRSTRSPRGHSAQPAVGAPRRGARLRSRRRRVLARHVLALAGTARGAAEPAEEILLSRPDATAAVGHLPELAEAVRRVLAHWRRVPR